MPRVAGGYERAVKASNSAAAITLHPNDHTTCEHDVRGKFGDAGFVVPVHGSTRPMNHVEPRIGNVVDSKTKPEVITAFWRCRYVDELLCVKERPADIVDIVHRVELALCGPWG